MEIKNRIKSKKNPFWRKIRIAGAVIAGVGTIIVAAPVALPVALVGVGNYLITIGVTVTGVAQITKE